MEQYILDLIKENNRVIIPNFGAFIVAKEKGFTILFNNFLSFNDGLLVDHVMTKEKIDKEAATAKVDAYVEKLKETLDSTGLYSINGLGTFTKDTNGILRFAQSEEINTYTIQETPKEEELLDIVGQEEELPKPVEPEPPKPEVKKTEEPRPAVPPKVAKVESPKAEKKEPVDKKPPVQEKPVQKEASKEKKIQSTSSYQYDDNENKNKSILIFVLSIVFLIIIFGAVYFIFFNGEKETPEKTVAKEELMKPVIKKELPTTESTKVAQPSEQANSGIIAGPSIKKTEGKQAPKPVQKTVTASSKPHHIIVGSFKNAANADRFVEKLKEQGFTDCQTVPRKNTTLVSIACFAKIREAEAKQEEILNEKKMESWILTRK
ncbi:MAG: SPOR domain-containing protein [Marinilabiliaceae bacterium]|nr:SPOR domain-containing protein [Marinilabiliaceae bacterium]